MAIGYILYNLKAGHGTSMEDIQPLEVMLQGDTHLLDISRITNYEVFFHGLNPDDYVVICGGDGTLNHFVNAVEGIDITNMILYYPIGTGNDFAADLGHTKGCPPFEITQYIKDLPVVVINDKQCRFINGIGYGIDGYCCEVGDELKKTATKPINYTSVAVKGLLFHYKPTRAKVTVDGVSHTYEKVWIAPTMNGRYYGGGMIPTPEQDRANDEKTLSVMVFHGAGRLKTLMVFPSIFKGEHIKHTEMVEVLTGREITVEFDRPTALQIDGETVLGVSSYTAKAAAACEEEHRTYTSQIV